MTELRTIIVTGTSSGIGAYCARALKAEGWRVFATARKPEDMAALEADGLEAFYLDYREPDSIARLVDEVLVHVAPKLLGAGPSLVGDLGISTIGEALTLDVVDVTLAEPGAARELSQQAGGEVGGTDRGQGSPEAADRSADRMADHDVVHGYDGRAAALRCGNTHFLRTQTM